MGAPCKRGYGACRRRPRTTPRARVLASWDGSEMKFRVAIVEHSLPFRMRYELTLEQADLTLEVAVVLEPGAGWCGGLRG